LGLRQGLFLNFPINIGKGKDTSIFTKY
jgi:hypothetical protein